MLLYELLILDSSDPVYNPIWRQGSYVMPFTSHLGIIQSNHRWSLSMSQESPLYWSYEWVSIQHVMLSGVLILSGCWHWSYSDLDAFISSQSSGYELDLNRILEIHLLWSSLICMGYGVGHLSGVYGPGMYTSDLHHILGSVRFIKPTLNLIGLSTSSYSVITAHHMIAGLIESIVSLWHVSSIPSGILFRVMRMGNLEGVLSTSIVSIFYSGFMTSASTQYGSNRCTHELYGITRYDWDNGLFSVNIESQVASVHPSSFRWNSIADRVILYDYIGCNPSKGVLFRSGPLIKGHGVVVNWIRTQKLLNGYSISSCNTNSHPSILFPVILIDQSETVRADISFRRGSSTYGVEQVSVSLRIYGGSLNGLSYSSGSLVKDYARKASFGEIFTFNKKTA